ncbi:MAG: M64 family metallopeptidase [Bacteroidota bacterium]
MKKLMFVLIMMVCLQTQAAFEDYFENKTLRIDYFHTGNNLTDSYSTDQLIMEPYWGGSKVNLVDIFDFGKYRFMVYDAASNVLLYSRTYSTLFSEWQTTDEAKLTVKTFSETVCCPFPKNKIRVEFQNRNAKGVFEKKFELSIDPKSYFISQERKMIFPKYDILNSGDPAVKVDIVIIPDGYTKDEMDKFIKDAKRFAGYLFNATPYKENKSKFNIWAIEAPSVDSGTDYPGTGIGSTLFHSWKNTIVGTSFYTFNTERYLMTSENKALHDVAANAPYDQIYIMVNTNHYGGGAIFNHYAVCVSENYNGEYVFTHEFGHSFAGLGDEYYDSETSYNEFYPLTVEPWEPNLTTLVNFDIKWKSLIGKDTPVPTPNDVKYKGIVGVFEGGGYVTKGVYRPSYDCSMKSISVNNFCPVCRIAIQKMIDFYSK